VIGIIVAAVFFGSVAFIGIQVSRAVCAGVSPEADGPATGTTPVIVLVAASALLGGILVWQRATPAQFGIIAIVVFALVACWCSDLLCGILPDYFTVAPLGLLLVFAVTQHNWELIVSALFVAVPFVAAAAFSRGYGMGWGDAKLVAISGAALGAPLAFLALAVACFAAVVGHRIAGWPKRPIAFAPYIAAATGLALPLSLLH
jgi:prepilin signal peptidase PulO-like enzyme (type II secretory pathway)